MPDQITGAELEEMDALIEFKKTRGFRYFRNLLHTHHRYCVEKSNKALKDHKDREAGEWLAKSEEPAKALNLIEKRKKEISDKREKGEQ